MIIKLVVGDWSRDGHERSENVLIESNLNYNSIIEAYKKATKMLGFDFCKTVCASYEENCLSKAYKKATKMLGFDFCKTVCASYEENCLSDRQFESLKKCGIDFDDDYVDSDDDMKYLDYDSFTDIYLQIIKLGNPDFEYSYIQSEERINIGGYGLFY